MLTKQGITYEKERQRIIEEPYENEVKKTYWDHEQMKEGTEPRAQLNGTTSAVNSDSGFGTPYYFRFNSKA